MMMQIRPFSYKGKTVSLTVGVASTNVAITQSGVGTQSIRLTNVGSNVVFFNLGKDNTTAAGLTDVPLLPNSVETFLLPNDITYIAAIAAATGNTLYITTGESA
jgi:hypothetical protein